MPADLEDELLRAAHALFAQHHLDTFALDDLRELVRARAVAFPRLSHELVAHVVEGLAESLVLAGFLDRAGRGYALTADATAYLEREPAYLRNEHHQAGVDVLALRRRG